MRSTYTPSVQRWLQDHCESSGQVCGGLVVFGDAGAGAAQTIAQWPASGGMTPPLSAAAEAAMQRARPVVVAPSVVPADARHNRVISLPLRAGERTLGAVALAVRADDSGSVETLMKDLETASVDIGARLGGPGWGRGDDDAARVLQLQDTLLAQPTLAEGLLALLTELAPVLGADRVTLGLVEAGTVEVVAVSNSAEFQGEQALLRLSAAAMQEAADQGARVLYPAPATEPARIVVAHGELNARCGQSLASVLLVDGGRAVGVLLAEWRSAAPAEAAPVALLESLACAIGPVVALGRRAERGWRARMTDALRVELGSGSRGVLRAVLMATLLATLAAAFWVPLPYRIGAPARIEGAVQRVVAAPMDGFLHKNHVRPGDTVHAGQLLVELADQDLVLEQRKWEAALAQHENAYAGALARADRAQFVIAQGKAGEARAQLELVRQQLGRTRLVAPIDGVVIKGDLSQALGAPVQRGDALLTLAPAERYRLIVEVDERDVAGVRPGQSGRLALAALPAETLPFIVDRVTPVATVRDGRNAFEVEARLLDAAPLLRPGLQGVVKIDAGDRSAAWIWGHRGWDWLRLATWAWIR